MALFDAPASQRAGVVSPRRVRRAGGSLRVDELVAEAPGREDELRALRAWLDLAAQTADDGVHRSFGDVRVVGPDLREQGRAAEDDAGARGQQVQQVELLFGELHPPTADDRLAS